jgi:hypothetical protein
MAAPLKAMNAQSFRSKSGSLATFGNNQGQSVVLSVGQIGLERIMTRLAQIGLAAALLVGGATFAIAQNGPPTPPGYPGAAQNPNLYGHRHYGYYHRHYYAYHPYYHHRYHHRYY